MDTQEEETDSLFDPEDKDTDLLLGHSIQQQEPVHDGNSRRSIIASLLSYLKEDAEEKPQNDLEKGQPKNIMDVEYYVSPTRILALARPEIWLILAGAVTLAFSAGTSLVLPGFAATVIDAVTTGGMDRLNEAVIFMCGVFVLDGIFTMLHTIFFDLSGERIVVRLRKQLFAAVVKQEVAFFDLNKTGELINRLSSDCEVLQGAITVNLSAGLELFAQAVGGLAILFYVSWKLTLVMLAVTPVVILVAIIYGTYISRVSKEKQDAMAKSTDCANECISNIRTVRSFSAIGLEVERYAGRVDISYGFARRLSISVGAFMGLMTVLIMGSIVLVLWYGGTLVIHGDMTTGVLTAFILYTISVAASLGGLSALAGELMKAAGARMPQGEKAGGQILEKFKGEVILKDVHFSYPVRTDTPVLTDLSLELQPGKVVALVGHSGAGKSTVTHLIERFYTPAQGQVLFDGVDGALLDADYLRDRIGLVSQEPVLFATSIADNIKYGMKRVVTQEEIEEAAKVANAHQFIMEQQDGYNTMVGERGIQLSGGQKQRIAIARALLKDPQILLLDEATSALDAESEYLVQDALDRLMQGRTVLVIAHRLSTVQNADLICVVDRGVIAEQGTHAELMLYDGIYKQLVSRQLQSA